MTIYGMINLSIFLHTDISSSFNTSSRINLSLLFINPRPHRDISSPLNVVHPVGNMNVWTISHDNPCNRCSDASCKTSVMLEPEGKSEDQKSYSGSSSVDHECLQKICMPIHPMFPPTQPGRLLPGPNVHDHECRLCDNVLEFHFLWQLPVLFCFWGQSGDTVITDPWKCQTSGNQLTSSISPFDLSLLVCRFRAARRAPWPAPHPRPPHRASTHGNASLASTSGT